MNAAVAICRRYRLLEDIAFRVHTGPGNPGKHWKIFEALEIPGNPWKSPGIFFIKPWKNSRKFIDKINLRDGAFC